MAYSSAALQQLRGQQLLNALSQAWGAFRQLEAYQAAVNDQYKRLASLREDKDIWTLSYAMRHPAKWVSIAAGIISVPVFFLSLISRDGDLLIACLSVPFTILGFFPAYTAQMHFIGKRLKGKVKSTSTLTKIAALFPVAVMLAFLIIGHIKGLGLLITLYGLVGVYATLCLLDIKFIHKAEHHQAKKQHFRKEDEEMALELSWRLNRLQNFCLSDAMQFAEALVPSEFQSSQKVGELLAIMKKYAVYDLHSAIRSYYQDQHMQQMEAEAAAARRAQEQAAAEQRAQTKILEWQRRDNQWHNKEMEYQQQRQNETLNDIKRQQKEYNDRAKRFMDDMEPSFFDF